MILTCPNCATRYFVADEALASGADGRTVRCTTCGQSWKAKPEAPLELTLAPEGAIRREPVAAASTFTRPADAIPREFRARAHQQKRAREAATSGAAWAAIAGVFAAVLIGAVAFRLDVVRAFPKSASAYAAIGLPVNPTGLTIEQVKAQPGLSGGRAALNISGQVRNIRAAPVAAPPLYVTLLDKSGRRLSSQITRLSDAAVAAGAARPFAAVVLDPPSQATDVEVTFVLNSKARPPAGPRRQAPQSTASLKLRPAASAPAVPPVPPEAAKPLPASDPLALRGASAG